MDKVALLPCQLSSKVICCFSRMADGHYGVSEIFSSSLLTMLVPFVT